MRSIAQLSAAAVLIATASLAQADAVRSEKNISLELANQIASAGVAACAANGHAVVVTVVDRAGIVRAVQRADNAGPHSLGSAERKAWTSASAKTNASADGKRAEAGRGQPGVPARLPCCSLVACRSGRQ
jgi:uncharacterized protein GlcG (DUF336 family)